MTEMTDELLARIGERAADPLRRYMLAAKDKAEGESAVELPIEEIERRFDERDRAERERGRDSALGDGDVFRMMQEKMREWSVSMPTMSFVEREDGTFRASSEKLGVEPLQPPPSETDWEKLEQTVGRPLPQDLKRLYSIADGGFGPGFAGLKSVQSIGASREDLVRRGPDYCGTIKYPDCFLPLAEEMLHYHYDLDTGRIISSNQDWQNDGLGPEDIYDIAFPSLAAMMKHWLEIPPGTALADRA